MREEVLWTYLPSSVKNNLCNLRNLWIRIGRNDISRANVLVIEVVDFFHPLSCDGHAGFQAICILMIQIPL